MTDAKLQRISIKRSEDSLDGRVISYLQSDPFNQDESLTELVMSTLKTYWLPLAMFNEGVRGEKMRQIGIVAISKLEAQISNIRRICGIDIDPVYVTPAVTHQTSITASNDNASALGLILDNQEINNNGHKNAQTNNEDKADDDWDDDDDWELMNLPQTEEERDANRMLGFGQ
ncbi:hypothetical protein [Nodularia sp. LEGE 04288]|uniref:hypothetical protein n=1 Tax=Nodularia sp. LEGE 04288 TaxID=1828639 RepID=UPI001D110CCF|nr:hypothetical protein [Nodularia sp. LEGE 04288]MCC2695341.1 hypothetical protein [Nodularia sp. LEGE 04288]